MTATITRGDTVRIIPDSGPERVMTVSHVEHHIITLTDPACPDHPDHPDGVNPKESAR